MTGFAAQDAVERERPSDLPEFDRPPVAELVLGVQFGEVRSFQTIHTGLLWDRKFRKNFPHFEEKPPLAPNFETFGSTRPSIPRIQLVQPGSIMPRLWFTNDDQTKLIQVQDDRFLYNWRRINDDHIYPRYATIREEFFENFKKFCAFLDEENLGIIEPNQCEVTYVNLIDIPLDVSQTAWMAHVFSNWSMAENIDLSAHGQVSTAEDATFKLRYTICDPSGDAPKGRLWVNVQPVIRSDDTEAIRFDLTARGSPMGIGMQGISDFFYLAREAIVRNFTALTTIELHEYWGRTK